MKKQEKNPLTDDDYTFGDYEELTKDEYLQLKQLLQKLKGGLSSEERINPMGGREVSINEDGIDDVLNLVECDLENLDSEDIYFVFRKRGGK